MRFLKSAVLILLALDAWSQTGFVGSNFTPTPPVISYVGTYQGSCYSGLTATCTTTSTFNAVKGNTLVVFVVAGTITTCPQASDFITDSAGNTFTPTLACVPSTNRGTAQMYVATVTNPSATDSVTAHFASNRNFVDLFVRQYSGVTTVGQPYDRHFSNTTNTFSPINTLRKYEMVVHCNMGDTSPTNSVYSVGTIAGSPAQNFVSNSPYGFTWSACEDRYVTTLLSGASATTPVTGGSTYDSIGITLAAWPVQPAPLAPLPQTFTTYDGSGKVVHPSVVYIAAGWNGYKYWIAAEPYPNGNSAFENPSIWASNDGITWTVPVGLTNPVSGTVTAPLYHDDGELFYDSASNQLWLYYMISDPSGPTSTMVRRTSSNGTTWSAETTILSLPNYPLISPSISKVGSTYYMWAVNTGSLGCNATSTSVDMRTSSDGVTWSATTPTNIKLLGNVVVSNIMPWHMNVMYNPSRDEFISLIVAKSSGGCAPTQGIYLARSHDGITWITYPFPLLHQINSTQSWDSGEMYRSTTLYDPATDIFKIWYSATDNSGGLGNWGIGYITSTYTTTALTGATTIQ